MSLLCAERKEDSIFLCRIELIDATVESKFVYF